MVRMSTSSCLYHLNHLFSSTKQLRQELAATQMYKSPKGVAEIKPGSVKALRMAAKRKEEHSRVSDPVAKARARGHSLDSDCSTATQRSSRSFLESLVEDILVPMPPGYECSSDKVRKTKKKHRSRSRSGWHSPVPRSLSRGRSPARTHKDKKHKKKNKKKKHSHRHRSRGSSCHSSDSHSTAVGLSRTE